MLQELLYLGPEQKLRRLFSSSCVQDLHIQRNCSNFQAQDANKAMIEENAGNPIANQKKALRVKIISEHK
jgi:hypothetical protein